MAEIQVCLGVIMIQEVVTWVFSVIFFENLKFVDNNANETGPLGNNVQGASLFGGNSVGGGSEG